MPKSFQLALVIFSQKIMPHWTIADSSGPADSDMKVMKSANPVRDIARAGRRAVQEVEVGDGERADQTEEDRVLEDRLHPVQPPALHVIGVRERAEHLPHQFVD